MFAEYVQGNIDDASCLFDAANHDAECEAVKKQAYILGFFTRDNPQQKTQTNDYAPQIER